MNYWIQKNINVGSVVKHIHTGTLMTVVSITTCGTHWGIYNEYTCQWFIGSKLHTDTFSRKTIILEKE